ncbi:MAG: helicase-related protein, partial [Desulforhabdus sp.]|nr:helicase-related protein [Desulforhabdus sp.]
MRLPAIIDNRSEETRLDSVLRQIILPWATQIDVAVGYFYYSGFETIAEGLLQNAALKEPAGARENMIRIIMSPRTDRTTARLLTSGTEFDWQVELREILRELEADLAAHSMSHAELFLSLLRQKTLNVRLYTQDFFHAKAYLARVELENGTHTYSIVGSSNFSQSGFTDNRELNITNTDDLHYNSLQDWFQELWESSTVDLNESLITVVDSERKRRHRNTSSLIGLSPFQLFLYIVRHYIGALTKERLEDTDLLAEFQRVGAENVLGKLEILGGAIVSDSVGLGKTFTAGEVIRRFREQNGRVLIVAPPTLIPQWKETLENFFKIPESDYVQFLSQGKLSQQAKEDVEKLVSEKPFDLIIIDEAHRARNSDTNLFRNIQALQPRSESFRSKIILLTATPFNNSIEDLRNLISLCTSEPKLFSAGYKPAAFEEFRVQTRLLKQGKTMADLEADPKFVENLAEIQSMLNGVMLLRMRSSIRKNYRNVSVGGKPLEFQDPSVRKIPYSYTDAHHELFQALPDFLEKLKLPHIILSKPESGKTLSYLFVLLLYKRIESSIYAFYCSLLNIIEKERELLAVLDSGVSIDAILKKYNRMRLETQIVEVGELFDTESESSYDSEDEGPRQFTTDDVRSWISDDIQLIEGFIEKHLKPLQTDSADPITIRDPKIELFLETLGVTRFRKCITFTEYRDTARYVEHRLTNSLNGRIGLRSAMVTAGHPDMERILARFAPRGQRANVDPADELDLLISTDVLAEGVNLQDADLLINFDLPWNPMRIVQRVGRINRIGSENRITVLNMTPDDEVLGQFLSLVEILSAKVEQVAILLGKEMAILSSE